MKIVNLDAFLALPAGTVFSKYEPCVFGDLMIKGASIEGTKDFFHQQIADAIEADGSDAFFAFLDEAEHGGRELAMDFDCQSRDGLFESKQLFAVWSRDDVLALIARLQLTVPGKS